MKMARAALLLALCASAAWGALQTPEQFFGHKIGADRTVLEWSKVVSWFRLLETNSNQIRVAELGKTVEGRPFIAATIAAPETLQRLDRYIDIQRRLADPRITPESAVNALVNEGKVVVLITCSIHSTELASTGTAVEFAYRLLTEDTPRFRAILRNTIFLLVPSQNPDGVDIVADWYRKTLGTAYEGSNPPWLYQHYVGHDNNRDWYILSQPEQQLTVGKLHNVWHPEIVYDVHQQGATASRMFVPPWLDPIEPNIDAMLMQETNMIGTSMASDLTAAGKPGISIHSSYDFWTPSRHYQAFHGGMRILTESASARIASPITISKDELDENALGYNAQERSWNFLEPWQGGTWHLRDIVDYQLIAMESCLYNAAIHREDLLRNFYRINARQTARSSPAGFVVAAKQRDPGATRKLLATLQAGMVEIWNAPGGGYAIPMHQPYSGYAKALLERQNYPNERLYPGGPPKRPYDVTAHTLPLLMGVDVRAADRLPATASRAHITDAPDTAALSASDSDSWRNVNAAWKHGRAVYRNSRSGDFAFENRGAEWKPVTQPRIGLYQSWIPVMDEGWTRWLFDQFGFRYSTLHDQDVRAGALRGKFDVIVLPDQGAHEIETGHPRGRLPEEYTGGIGTAGEAALREFVQGGGTLICLNRASGWAIAHLRLNVKSAVAGLPNREFYVPGSLLNVRLEQSPLTLGLPREIAIWSEQSPAWEAGEGAVARYPGSDVLASGWLLGAQYLVNRAALVDARYGKGHAILFGMRPQYRAQSYLTFKLLFNSLLYFSDQTASSLPLGSAK
jgi:hypothetical protein